MCATATMATWQIPGSSQQVKVGIRDSDGNTVMGEVGVDQTIRDALSAMNTCRRDTIREGYTISPGNAIQEYNPLLWCRPSGEGWPEIKPEQLTLCPGANWTFDLNAEVAGGILVPLMGASGGATFWRKPAYCNQPEGEALTL
jgi:hypothetical protein